MFFKCSRKSLIAAIEKNDLEAVKKHLKIFQFKKEWLDVDSDGNSPLLKAAEFDRAEMIPLLLEAGADVNQDSSSWYPAGLAANKYHTETLKALLKAELNFQSLFQAMYQAIKEGHTGLVEMLFSYQFSPGSYLKSNHDTYIHTAAKNGRAAIITLLAKQDGVDVNAVNKDGDAALHIAVTANKFDVVKALLDSGAKANMPDAKGRTALDLARDKKDPYILPLVAKHAGATPPPAITQPAPPAPTKQDDKPWVRLDDDKVARVGVYPQIDEKITEVFNFAARQKFIITQSLTGANKAVSPPEDFKTLDQDYLRQAFDAFKQQGGQADEEHIFNRFHKPRPLSGQ